jgi:hypothetical protein
MRVKAYEDRSAGNLRPAAKEAGVQIADVQRFGRHNLRHSKIQTTLDLYTQEDRTKRGRRRANFSPPGMNATTN